MLDKCEHCSGRNDRPGLFGCRRRNHPTPSSAQQAVAEIEADLSDRRGIGQEWQRIDADLKVAIRDRWAEIIKECQ